MPCDQPVLVQKHNGVAHLLLNRPQGGDAITIELAHGLQRAIEDVAQDDDSQAVLLSGIGRMFCAGGDLMSMRDAEDRGAYLHALVSAAHDAVRTFAELDKPVVTAVQGSAAGGIGTVRTGPTTPQGGAVGRCGGLTSVRILRLLGASDRQRNARPSPGPRHPLPLPRDSTRRDGRRSARPKYINSCDTLSLATEVAGMTQPRGKSLHVCLRLPGEGGTVAENLIPAAFDDAVPLHHQVYLQLRQEIADGLWVGRGFGSEQSTADRFGVSVITSRSALERLSREGWLARQRGRGTTVIREPRPRIPAGGPALVMLPSMDQGYDDAFGYRVLSTGVGIAPATACVVFGLNPGAELWQCSRLRTRDGALHSVTHNAQRPELGNRHSRRDLEQRPMASILADRGIKLARMRRRINVGHAPPLVAHPLGLTVTEPVLIVEFTLHDDDDSAVEWVRIYLHPEQPGPEESMELASGVWTPHHLPY
jgi:GntR family transcriptional regulator